jgi:NDP-sugar pyrophosphorylase family protein
MAVQEVLILVGGLGSRLRGIVNGLPKPMARVAERPFLEWLVLQARKKGIRKVIFCSGYLGTVIRNHFGDGANYDVRCEYSQEPKPLGTGGALRFARTIVENELVLVLNGDSYCRYDIERLEKAQERFGSDVTLWLQKSDDCTRFGAVEVGNDGLVKALVEKPADMAGGLINAGVYLMRTAFLDSIAENCFVSLEKDVLPTLIGNGLSGVIGEGPFIDIGTPESFRAASEFMELEESYQM